MNNRYTKFGRYVMNIERYGKLLREIDEDNDLNGENVLRKIEKLEEQRCEHVLEWEDRDFTFIAHYQNIYDGTLLHAASVAGCKRAARALLEAGAEIGAKCLRGFTPLHVAAKTGQKDMVEYLLQNEMNVDEADNKGRTSLHLSAAFGSPECVATLLAVGARVNVTDKERNTPLILAVNGHVTENIAKTLRILLRYGADVNVRDGVGNSVLHRNILKIDNTVVLEGHLSDSDVNVVDQTAKIVFLNKEMNTEEIMELLLNNGADVNVRNHAGDTPLHCAIRYSTLAVIKVLIEEGADVNGRDGRICTPLYCIGNRYDLYCIGNQPAREECFKITKLLMDNGSNMNIISSEGTVTLLSIIRRGWTFVAATIIGFFVLENPEAVIPDYLKQYPVLTYYWHVLAIEARQELKQMSATHIGNKITIHDILRSKNRNELASYMENIIILNAVEERFGEAFPLYVSHFVNQYHKGAERLKLLKVAEEIIVTLFHVSKDRREVFPEHVASEIARYLSNRDIKRLKFVAENIRGKKAKLATSV